MDGDLNAAIDQYRKLTQGKNRAVAAQALLRMGQCYEKLGDAEARKAYERLVRDFGDQTESAQAARVRLAALTKPETADSSNLRPISVTGYAHSVSPDGRFLLQSGPNDVLNVLEVSTQKVRQLAASPFDQPVVSPDGRQVAFIRRTAVDAELRVVNFDGSAERRVWKSETDWRAGIPQWFPDGKRVLILQWDGSGGRRLLSIAVDSGEPTRLWEGQRIYSTRLSPDGQYVTFMRHLRNDPINEQIWLLRLSDKSETLLFDGQAYINFPDWTPDGKGVVFLSDRRQPGTVDLWFLSVVEGKPPRFPTLVKTGVGEMGKGFQYPTVWPAGPITRDGTYFLSRPASAEEPEMSQVMKIGFDPENGKVVGSASFVSPRGGEHSLGPAFSRDGRLLAYIKITSAGLHNVCIQSVDSGEERTVPLSPPPQGLETLLFFPDGRSLLIRGTHPKEGVGLFQADTQTGSWTALKKPAEKELRGWPSGFSPDGSTLYFNRFPGGGASILTARIIESGVERVFRSGANGPFAVSPDGKNLASLHPEGKDLVLVLYPTGGGSAQEIYRFRGQQFGEVKYTPDGKSLFVGTFPVRYGVQSLFRIPVEGGDPQPTGLEVSPEDQAIFPRVLSEINIHPNGRLLVYTAVGAEQPQQYKTFALSNFLPGFKPAK